MPENKSTENISSNASSNSSSNSSLDVFYSTMKAALDNLKARYIEAQDSNSNTILDIKLTAMISLINDISLFMKDSYDKAANKEE